MTIARTAGSRWVLAAAALAAARIALAQTAAHTGLIVAADHRCLDAGTPASGPGVPPVALAPCDGRPSQRWVVVSGDYRYTRSAAGACLSFRPSTARGARSNEIELTTVACSTTSQRSDVTVQDSRLQAPGGCVAQRVKPTGVVLVVEPCADIPEQRWSVR